MLERKVCNFKKGDVLIHKSKPVNALVMVTERLVRATENSAGGRSYEDLLIGPSKARTSFGWQLVLNMDTSTDNDASSPHLTTDDALAETRTNDIDIMVKQDQTIKSSNIMTGTIRAETDGQAIVV